VRLQSHSSDDDQRRYRSAEDLDEMLRHDPLESFRADLESSSILADGEADQMRQECQKVIDAAQAEADQDPAPDPASALDYVYGEA
jgi:2-oxoisovalerate dehydrogenase E1 component alpha subunit